SDAEPCLDLPSQDGRFRWRRVGLQPSRAAQIPFGSVIVALRLETIIQPVESRRHSVVVDQSHKVLSLYNTVHLDLHCSVTGERRYLVWQFRWELDPRLLWGKDRVVLRAWLRGQFRRSRWINTGPRPAAFGRVRDDL